MMKINLEKTKIMVFQKRARKNAELRFRTDGQIIDVVQEYTIKELESPHQEVSQCHVNISKKKLLIPSLAWHHIRISAN